MAYPTRMQKIFFFNDTATTEIYVEEVQLLLEGAEDAGTQI